MKPRQELRFREILFMMVGLPIIILVVVVGILSGLIWPLMAIAFWGFLAFMALFVCFILPIFWLIQTAKDEFAVKQLRHDLNRFPLEDPPRRWG